MKKLITSAVVAGSLVLTGNAFAGQRQGVVVSVDATSKLVAVADARGHVSLIHAAPSARVQRGMRAAFAVRPLRNGTFAAGSVRVLGHVQTAHVRGIVLARRPGALIVSARGAVLKLTAGKARTTAAAKAAPAVGSAVEATISVGGAGLAATHVQVLDPSGNSGALAGTLTAIGAGTITVADNGVAATLAVPDGVDVSTFHVGDEVLAYFAQEADGSFALSALSGDATAAEADDATEVEGDVEAAESDVADDESDDEDVQADDVDDGEQHQPGEQDDSDQTHDGQAGDQGHGDHHDGSSGDESDD